ncbi:MAG: nitrous oxide-stimulated promoter family protein [Elusimicrobia bacterium]|nr:nitrous oxide-stimulated promoter family protein [Elusimicrobiota bacterium]
MDKKTVGAMVKLYCGRTHGAPQELCPDCNHLLMYAHHKLDRCFLGRRKTTCAKCPIHCYGPVERDAMRHVMRETGPHMFPRHPWLSLWHAWQSLRGMPQVRSGNRRQVPRGVANDHSSTVK